MGLKDFFRNWSKRGDADRLEVAEEELREHDYDHKDYEAMKDDVYINDRTWAGSGAERSALDDLDSL